jgi:hypothetical protein
VIYRERQRLADIQAAIDAIRSHLQRGDLPELEHAIQALAATLPPEGLQKEDSPAMGQE